MSFVPKSFQAELSSRIILNEKPNDEAVPLDVLFVGAGPAGLAGAIELANLVKDDDKLKDLQIGVLEKAKGLGEHCLSGAVVNPIALRALFPELNDSDFPFRTKVTKERVYVLTPGKYMRIPTPPTMQNHGYYVASLCELVRWLGEKANALGINILTGFPVESLLTEGNKVVGVRTTAAGLNRDGTPGASYMPPTDVTAKVTVLTEGTRGTLTQGYLKWRKITSPRPQIYALGVKEIWETKQPLDAVVHTLGWPLPTDAFGGSFMYPMDKNLVAIGLVAGLDYSRHTLDIHQMLQKMKTHPLFDQYLKGGELVEWGAKTIPEGGYYALPERLHGEGLLMAGDAAGFVNVAALKGIHHAINSGMLAARSIFQALKNDNMNLLSEYDKMIRSSTINTELYKTRNMRHAFTKGFFIGGFKAAVMTATGGAFPGFSVDAHEDADAPKSTDKGPDEKVGISKVDAVFLAGNTTRDDIPKHLIVGRDVPPEVADFYHHLCPAGVYERQGDKLIINAPNCIDCKATDVVGPRWTPREGGSGPSYKRM
jgi:electron-transferring-flavoprotein dehydrogenase